MECESGATRSIMDELHSLDIQRDEMAGEVVLLEVSLMNLILRLSKEIKWNVNGVLLEVSLMTFIVRISNEIKWNVKMVLLEI